MPGHHQFTDGRLQWSFALLALVGVLIGVTIWWRQSADHARPPAASAPSSLPNDSAADNPQAAVGNSDPRSEFLRLMNLAKALLETGDYGAGIENLELALEIDPASSEARRNLARAYLFSDKPGLALQQSERLREQQQDSVALDYLTGLALSRLSRHDEAIPYLERAATSDSRTAAIRYQLAVAYDAIGQAAKMAEQLRETVRLDPQHSAAQYRLAVLARNDGDMEQWRQRLLEYKRLQDLYGEPTSQPIALEACIHTTAEPPDFGPVTGATPTPPIDVRFIDVTDKVFDSPADRSTAALAIVDMDEDGRYTFLVVGRDGSLSLLTLNQGGRCVRTPLSLQLPDLGDIQDCVVGNFYDEPVEASNLPDSVGGLFADVLILGDSGAHLLLRTGPKQYRDMTQSAGIAGLTGRAARWVDYEYDGDLDLVIAGEAGLQLWQNNGDGTLNNVTDEVGIANSLDCIDVEASDLDSNSAVDFIVAQGAQPTVVFQNQRAGRFAPMPQPPGPWPVARHILANDLDNDGQPDVALVGTTHVVFMLSQVKADSSIDLSGWDLKAATLVDYDNDGWLDVCAVGQATKQPDRGQVRLWRNSRAESWSEVTVNCELDEVELPPLGNVLAADIDADGDTDLLLLTDEGGRELRLLRNEGGHVNGQLKVRLLSLLVGNRGGIGTQLEVRAGDYWATRWIQREWPVEVGLNGHSSLDAVRTVWTDGVVRNQTEVASTSKPLDFIVTEIVATGSCPYLYVWDGHQYRFVTDLLGGGAMGVPISRDELEPVNPFELVVIGDDDQFRPIGQAYTIKIGNEQREVDYLDYLQLLAVDHPRHVEVHSSSMLGAASNGLPRVRAVGNLSSPVSVEGDDGVDRTSQLQAIDGVFAVPGSVLPPPLRGICRPLTLTLEFEAIPTDRPLVLALTGWLQYGTSSSNIALSQNPSLAVIPPTLEAETVDGEWHVLNVDLGLPAGKTKTILCDLEGTLPPGSKRLRLTTAYEIRWDRIVLGEACDLDTTRIHELEFDQADLQWRGFSEMCARADGQPTIPDFHVVLDRPPWRTAVEGWYTRYGDVQSLLKEPDGETVLLNGGDMLTLRVPASTLPPVPREMARTFFLDCVGWNKEGDPNTVGGESVSPLPSESTTAPNASVPVDDQRDWRLRYNTRWVARDHFHPSRTKQSDQ